MMDIQLFTYLASNAVVPLPLRERLGEGALKYSTSLSSPLTQPSPARGEGSPVARLSLLSDSAR